MEQFSCLRIGSSPSSVSEIRMTQHKKALVIGVTGQDGSYLAELLLSKGYKVHAMVRRASTFNRSRIEHLYVDIHEKHSFRLYYGDLADASAISDLIHRIAPDEIYNLGAQSHVQVSFELPEYTADVDALGATRVLEAVRQSGIATKIYQASSSEMFGEAPPPQNELTPFIPRSPYACAKLYAFWMAKNYRDGSGIWCSNGILFNHESPRRGPTFVTRKIAAGVASIVSGKQKYLYLGNLNARRDWGFAPEYVEAMWRILQCGTPNDFVLGTGESHTVREFLDAAFDYVGLGPEKYVRIDKRYMRPIDVGELRADSKKAHRELNWNPRVKFRDLVKIMVDAEMDAMGLKPIGEGDSFLTKAFPDKWWRDGKHIPFSVHRDYY